MRRSGSSCAPGMPYSRRRSVAGIWWRRTTGAKGGARSAAGPRRRQHLPCARRGRARHPRRWRSGPAPEGQEGSMGESARDALDSFDEAMVWDDESKLELACRFIDEQGLLDEFKAFLREQAENEADDGD